MEPLGTGAIRTLTVLPRYQGHKFSPRVYKFCVLDVEYILGRNTEWNASDLKF